MRTFPLRVLTGPSAVFAEIAAGTTGWAWPLALYAASAALSALLSTLLPPEFVQSAFEGLSVPQGRGYLFNLAVALPGGFVFTLFTCSLTAAFSALLSGGRLAPRLALPAAGVGAYGLIAAAAFRARAFSPAPAAAALCAAAFAVWAALRDRRRYSALLKAALAISAVTLAADLAAGAAALAGSTAAYTACEYFFSLFSLVWLVKALAAVYGLPGARGAAAAVLAMLGSAAFAFSLYSMGLLPQELFQAVMLM